MTSSSTILWLALALASALFFGALAQDDPSSQVYFSSAAVLLATTVIFLWRKGAFESKADAADKAAAAPLPIHYVLEPVG
jgi:hypothetical protein